MHRRFENEMQNRQDGEKKGTQRLKYAEFCYGMDGQSRPKGRPPTECSSGHFNPDCLTKKWTKSYLNEPKPSPNCSPSSNGGQKTRKVTWQDTRNPGDFWSVKGTMFHHTCWTGLLSLPSVCLKTSCCRMSNKLLLPRLNKYFLHWFAYTALLNR